MRLPSLMVLAVLATSGCEVYTNVDEACVDTVSNDAKLDPKASDGLRRINCFRRMTGVARVPASPTVQIAADNEVRYVTQNPDYDMLLGALGPVDYLQQRSELPGYTGANVYERLTKTVDTGGAGYIFTDLANTSYWEFISVLVADTPAELPSGEEAIDFLMRFPQFRQVSLQPSWLDGAYAEADLSQQWFTDGGYFGVVNGGLTETYGGGTITGGTATAPDVSLAPYGRVYYMVVIYTAPHYEHADRPVLLPVEDETDVPLFSWSTNRNVIGGDGTYAPTQVSYPISLLMGTLDPSYYSAVDQNQYKTEITAASIVGPEGPLITNVVHPGDDAEDSFPDGRLLRTTLAIYAAHPFEPSTDYTVYADYTTPAGQFKLQYGFHTRNDDPGVDPLIGLTPATTAVTQRRAGDWDSVTPVIGDSRFAGVRGYTAVRHSP